MRKLLWRCGLALLLASCGKTEVVQSFPDSFVGVGVELKEEGGAVKVVRTLPGGPAALAGMLPGDKVLAVDGASTSDMSLGDVVMRLRGEPETQVQLTVLRQAERITVVVRRRGMQKAGEGYAPAR